MQIIFSMLWEPIELSFCFGAMYLGEKDLCDSKLCLSLYIHIGQAEKNIYQLVSVGIEPIFYPPLIEL